MKRNSLHFFTLCSILLFCATNLQAGNPVRGKTFTHKTHTLAFAGNWKVIESGFTQQTSSPRECCYAMGDESFSEEEGTPILVMCDGTVTQYILSPEADYLSLPGGAVFKL